MVTVAAASAKYNPFIHAAVDQNSQHHPVFTLEKSTSLPYTF